MTAASFPSRHVVGRNNRRREQQPADDGEFSRQVGRAGPLQDRVREDAADEHADRRADVRKRRHQAGLQERHPACRDQVGRKPGDEEHLRRIPTELPQRCAEDLAPAEQRRDMAPRERHGLALVLSATARLDVVEFRLVHARAVRRIAVEPPPEHAEEHPEASDDDEQSSPAQALRDPEQRDAQEPKPDILTKGIDPIGARALVLRKPDGEDSAVAREARRFEDPEADARQDQTVERLHHAHQRRAQGPEDDCDEIGEASAEPIEKDAAWNLEQGVAPREGGEDQSHRGRVQRRDPSPGTAQQSRARSGRDS